MRRWFFNIIALMSLLLCLGAIVMWVRSNRPFRSAQELDRVDIKNSDPCYWIQSVHGQLVLCRQVGTHWYNPLTEFHWLGIDFGGGWGPGSILWNLAVPYWMLVLLSALLPALRAEIWRRERTKSRRDQKGLCPACGYDLRATPERCPECGAVPEEAPT